MPEKGLSGLWYDKTKKWELVELPVYQPDDDEIVVRVTATGICGSDLHVTRGDGRDENSPERGPLAMGHEMTGVVHSLGKKVKTDSLKKPLKEGDRVIFPFFFPCISCYNCMRGEFGACKYRSRIPYSDFKYCNSGYSQYFVLRKPHIIFHSPKNLKDDALVSLNCALAQVVEAFNVGKINFGDNIVIQGAGALGIYATAVARSMGANEVIVIDGHESRLELAKKCGASKTINISEIKSAQERIDCVFEYTDGIGADIALEVVGFPAVVEEGIKMVRMRGKYLEIGSIAENSFINIDTNYLVSQQIRMTNFQHYDPWILPKCADFLERTKDQFPLTSLVSHRFKLEDINEAFEKSDWLGENADITITRAMIEP